jgi:hypothetical protein
MSEENSTVETNDGTWSGLKKTIIGTLSTAVLAGGTWLTTTLFNGHGDSKEEPKTETAAPAAPVVVNIQNTNQQKQQSNSGGPTIIKERVIEKEAAPKEPAKPVKKEEESW